MLNPLTFDIPAKDSAGTPGSYPVDMGGKFLFVVAASGAFKIQFDAAVQIPVRGANYKFTKSFSRLKFFNYGTMPVSLELEVGDESVDYEGANEAKVAATYAKGCFDISDAATLAAFSAGYITSISKVTGGNSYKVGDVLTVNGGALVAGGLPAKIRVDSIGILGNGISGWTVLQGGQYSVLPASPNTPTGGSGSGAQFNLQTVAAGGGLTLNADGSLTLAAGNSISTSVLSGFDGANRRNQITFGVLSGALFVRSPKGGLFTKVTTKETFVTSAAYSIDGGGSPVTFTIGENFYA